MPESANQTLNTAPESKSAGAPALSVRNLSVLFGKNAAEHADGHADDRGLREQNKSAADGVGHAAAGFTDGFGQLGEKRKIDGAEPQLGEVVKHQHQRRDDENRARERNDLHQDILEIAPSVVGGCHQIDD